jgi:hypothetical protein
MRKEVVAFFKEISRHSSTNNEETQEELQSGYFRMIFDLVKVALLIPRPKKRAE